MFLIISLNIIIKFPNLNNRKNTTGVSFWNFVVVRPDVTINTSLDTTLVVIYRRLELMILLINEYQVTLATVKGSLNQPVVSYLVSFFSPLHGFP